MFLKSARGGRPHRTPVESTGLLPHATPRRTRSTPRPSACSSESDRAAPARAAARASCVVEALLRRCSRSPPRSRSRCSPTPTAPFSLPLAAAFVVAYAVVARRRVPRSATATSCRRSSCFVPMLLLLPTPLVPLLVVARDVVARGRVDVAARRARRRSGCCSRSTTRRFALAPAVVLVALGAQLPDWASWPAYVAALAAQFAADARARAAARLARPRHRRRASCSPRSPQAYRVDALLAPIGLLAAIAAADAPAAALLVLAARRAARRLRPRARGADRPDDRARPRLPRHRAAAARPARGGRRVHRPPHRRTSSSSPCASPSSSGVRRGRAQRDRARRAAARHRQDPHPRRDHQQARASSTPRSGR